MHEFGSDLGSLGRVGLLLYLLPTYLPTVVLPVDGGWVGRMLMVHAAYVLLEMLLRRKTVGILRMRYGIRWFG